MAFAGHRRSQAPYNQENNTMPMMSEQSGLVARFFSDRGAGGTRSKAFWSIPALLLLLYVLVLGAFFLLLRQFRGAGIFTEVLSTTSGYLLIIFLISCSIIIIFCLLVLWRYSRTSESLETALINETSFRRSMENSMSTGMRVVDMQGRIIYVNPAFCRLIGWNENDLIGQKPPFPYWRDSHFEDHVNKMDIVLTGATPSSGLEIEAVRRDGSTFTARLYVSPFRDKDGNQIGWMTSMTDITEPKRIREALTASHERFMTVLESLDDAISVTHDSGEGLELLFANRTYRRLFGSDARGHKELLKAYNNRPDENDPEYFSYNVEAWFEIHQRTLSWTDGRQVRMQVARDITRRRQYEEKLQQQQEKIELNSRLTTMGEMASSLAHELNQPLTAIINYNTALSMLLTRGSINEDRFKDILDKSIHQAERAGKIISRIREFVKRSEPQKQRIPVRTIIDNTLDLAIIESRKHNIEIIENVPADLPTVNADPILIEQVLLNLIKNGMEAMTDVTKRSIQVNVMQTDRYITVCVIDHGHGLKDSEQLFAPFYSTKREGLGMGLNICRTIIESHQGRLWAEPNPEGGTIFTFCLPCSQEVPAAKNETNHKENQ